MRDYRKVNLNLSSKCNFEKMTTYLWQLFHQSKTTKQKALHNIKIITITKTLKNISVFLCNYHRYVLLIEKDLYKILIKCSVHARK